MNLFVKSFIFCICLTSIFGKDITSNQHDNNKDDYIYSDDEAAENYEEYNMDSYDEHETEIKDIPEFRSVSGNHSFESGTTVRLPCFVDKMPKDFVLMWLKVQGSNNKSDLIAVSDKIIINDVKKRFSIEIHHSGEHIGSSLIIASSQKQDEGIYYCEMASNSRKKIIHTVHIRSLPSITKVPKTGLLIANQGDTISLSCKGRGTPEPTITWSRLNKKMPDGSDEKVADELIYQNVNRLTSGTYVCSANNGLYEAVSEKIEVQVNYSPEIEASETLYYTHAQTGNEVELVCNVHSHPLATVTWFKDFKELSKSFYKLGKNGHKYSLTLSNIKREDFGNYSCRAKNRFGEVSKVLEISDKAGFPEFSSSPRGLEPESYLIEWSSFSTSDITNFELKVRRSGASAWHSHEVIPIRLGGLRWAGKKNLKSLEAATQYEARVAAQNENGWSRDGPIFHFATFGAVPLSNAARSEAMKTVSLSFIPLLFSLCALHHYS